jgi:hypothetical protein
MTYRLYIDGKFHEESESLPDLLAWIPNTAKIVKSDEDAWVCVDAYDHVYRITSYQA